MKYLTADDLRAIACLIEKMDALKEDQPPGSTVYLDQVTVFESSTGTAAGRLDDLDGEGYLFAYRHEEKAS